MTTAVGIDAADDPPGVLPVRNPEFDAARRDGWHGSRLREAQTLAALKTSEQEPGFQPRTRRERRSLDLGA